MDVWKQFENNGNKAKDAEKYTNNVKRAFAELMRTPHGRDFIDLVVSGVSAQTIAKMMLEYNNNI